MDVEKWLQTHTSSLSGKVVAISGATGGIGKELCVYLARLGAELILLDRNEEKSSALQKSLENAFPRVSVKRFRVDLEDIETVKAVAETLRQMPLDALILNAGAYHIERHTCSTGYDNVFQINFVSPYYLARTLQPYLQARDGRIVAVGSIAHTYSHTDMTDVDFSKRAKHSLAYGNAKRFLMFSLYGLYDGKAGLAVTHPGITFTNITAHYPKLIFALIKHPMKVIFMKPKKACLSILRGLFEDCENNMWIGPKCFSVWGFPKKQVLSSCDTRESQEIFETAENIYRQLSKNTL